MDLLTHGVRQKFLASWSHLHYAAHRALCSSVTSYYISATHAMHRNASANQNEPRRSWRHVAKKLFSGKFLAIVNFSERFIMKRSALPGTHFTGIYICISVFGKMLFGCSTSSGHWQEIQCFWTAFQGYRVTVFQAAEKSIKAEVDSVTWHDCYPLMVEKKNLQSRIWSHPVSVIQYSIQNHKTLGQKMFKWVSVDVLALQLVWHSFIYTTYSSHFLIFIFYPRLRATKTCFY